jgi:hypothetical protein
LEPDNGLSSHQAIQRLDVDDVDVAAATIEWKLGR